MSDEQREWVRLTLERFEAPLLAYVERLLRDAHAAQDVTQEAFLALLRQDRAAVEARLPAWLFTVARRLALDRLRKSGVMERTDTEAVAGCAALDPGPAFCAERSDAARAALAALERLPASQSEAIRLRMKHGLSYREIAEVMETTVDHVGVLLHEGLSTLRRRLGAPAAKEARS